MKRQYIAAVDVHFLEKGRNMAISDLSGYALSVCAAVAVLSGCDGSQARIGVPGLTAQSVTAARPDHSGTWMSPDAKKQDLLYISDQGKNTKGVYVLSYPKGKLVGTLTGFVEPAGECSDKAGDVFIVNGLTYDILEYAHGGTSPIATLSETGEYPSGCSVDPATGNLAVADYCSGDASGCTGPGGVAIFTKASGSPTEYTDAKILHLDFCGYDSSGNLFVDGTKSSGGFALAELHSGGTSLTNIKLNRAIKIPGAVQWDGTYLAVGDNKSGSIYQVTISGKSGTEVGSTALVGSNDVVQFWIQPPNVIGPNAGSADVGLWKYPAGGSPTKTIGGFGVPIGATVSLAR